MLKECLTERVDSWARLGNPSLLERFVLRKGSAYTPSKRIGRKGTPNQCFGNAARYVLSHADKASYVEGFAMDKKIGWPIHHAWVTTNGTDAIDHTLDAEGYEYFGVLFSTDLMRRTVIKNGVYGLLDTGYGINHELMFKIDPELEAICKAVKADRDLMKLMEKNNAQ